MPLECDGRSRRTAHPTPRWWQQQYVAGRWYQAACFPGDAGSSLQAALPVWPLAQSLCGRTGGKPRLGLDSACLGGAAKTPECLRGCCWWRWVQGPAGELWMDKTGTWVQERSFIMQNQHHYVSRLKETRGNEKTLSYGKMHNVDITSQSFPMLARWDCGDCTGQLLNILDHLWNASIGDVHSRLDLSKHEAHFYFPNT